MAEKQNLCRAVVAPVFNEPDTWRAICRQLTFYFDLVVVVDDGSTLPLVDPEFENVVLLRHHGNLGKGAALETGFRYCLARGADIVGTIDMDGEHDPRNFRDGLAVSRYFDLITLSRSAFFVGYSAGRRYRNRMVSWLLSRKYTQPIRDTQSGMRLYSERALRISLQQGLPKGYAVETATLENAMANGLDVVEIPMAFEGGIRSGKKYSSIGGLVSDILSFAGSLMSRPPKSRKGEPPALLPVNCFQIFRKGSGSP